MMICCSRNISDYYQYWKQCCAASYFCGNSDKCFRMDE